MRIKEIKIGGRYRLKHLKNFDGIDESLVKLYKNKEGKFVKVKSIEHILNCATVIYTECGLELFPNELSIE